MPLLDLSVNYSVSVTRIPAMFQQKLELGNLNLFSSLILVHAHIMFHGLLLVWLFVEQIPFPGHLCSS